MTRINLFLFSLLALLLTSCGSNDMNFPVEKRYWDHLDYADATRELKYGYEKDEKLPSFKDPETRIIVEKYTDPQNFNVVLDDAELGLKHRNNMASKFFERWRDMTTVYRATDRKDNYLYEEELLKVEHFGMGLQLKYFKLGNDVILNNADDPNSKTVQNNINSNIDTLIENFNLYLDEIDDEKAFSEEGKALFAQGIDIYFPKLVAQNPDAKYSGMLRKIELMHKKSESQKIKTALTNVKNLIDSKKDPI